MLDGKHPTLPYDTRYDENTYICGSITGHTVVVTTCPPGETACWQWFLFTVVLNPIALVPIAYSYT